MIFGWLRLLVVGFVILTLLYWLVWIYARSVRREALEKEWDAGDHAMDRDAFVEAGMERYRRGLRPRLILLIYIVPAIVVPAIIYLLNFN